LPDLERGRLIETRSLPLRAGGAGSLSAGMRSALLVSGHRVRRESSAAQRCARPGTPAAGDRSSSRTRGRRSAPAAALRAEFP